MTIKIGFTVEIMEMKRAAVAQSVGLGLCPSADQVQSVVGSWRGQFTSWTLPRCP